MSAKLQGCDLWVCLKMFVLIHLYCPDLFQTFRDFGTRSWILFRRLNMWSSLGKISGKPSWKLENMVSKFYKTISNINIVCSNCLQTRYKFAIFFHFGWLCGKRPCLPVQPKTSFSKDFGIAFLNSASPTSIGHLYVIF